MLSLALVVLNGIVPILDPGLGLEDSVLVKSLVFMLCIDNINSHSQVCGYQVTSQLRPVLACHVCNRGTIPLTTEYQAY